MASQITNRSYKSKAKILKTNIGSLRRKIQSNENDKSDNSSSSSDGYLVNPKDIDLASLFSNLVSNEKVLPKITDSLVGKFKPNRERNSANEAGPSSSNNVDFRDYQMFANNLEMAKIHLKNYRTNPSDQATTAADDVKQLLALGEKTDGKMVTNVMDDSDTDWEEVEGMISRHDNGYI